MKIDFRTYVQYISPLPKLKTMLIWLNDHNISIFVSYDSDIHWMNKDNMRMDNHYSIIRLWINATFLTYRIILRAQQRIAEILSSFESVWKIITSYLSPLEDLVTRQQETGHRYVFRYSISKLLAQLLILLPIYSLHCSITTPFERFWFSLGRKNQVQ